MEIVQPLEVPLLGAHPNSPDAGWVSYYTLLSDSREYVKTALGNIQYRNPRIWNWHGTYQGTTAGAQWLRNFDASPQSRRTNFLCPYILGRCAQLTFSSRNDLLPASQIYVRIYEDAIDAAGDVTGSNPITVEILSDDIDVVSHRNGKRFLIDLRSRNIELDNTKRYALRIDNIGNATSYRDVAVDLEIEERVIQP